MTVFKELKRRNVFKVATAYLITSWLIIQIVTVLEPHMNLPEWIVPVIIVFLVVGFPIACLFAWAFELTPEGIKRSKDVVVDDSISNITGRKIDFGIIAAMAIAVIFLTYEAYFSENNSADKIAEISTPLTTQNTQEVKSTLSEQVTSIAVLPFVNMSNDPEQEYFSDGLSEELLNVLARIKQLKVAARTSSFFFKNKNMDIKEIAKKLDVEHVLEGSVRKSGTKLRVTAQLIQADSGYHLWSETYDYELDDVFKIQDEISAAVVKQLKITLLKEQIVALTEHGTRIPKAQDAYLLGRYFMRARTPQSLEKAVKAFKRSLLIDPENQLAISGLVDTLNLQEDHSNLQEKDFLELAKPLLIPFFDGENNSAEIYTSLGAYFEAIGDKTRAINYFEKAIEKNPNYAQAYHWYAVIYTKDLLQMSKAEKAKVKTLFKKALSLDPASEVLLSNLYYEERFEGRLIEAEYYLSIMLEVNPQSSYIAGTALSHYWPTGLDWVKAWEITQNNYIEISGGLLSSKIMFYLSINMLKQAEQTFELMKISKTNPSIVADTYLKLNIYKLNKKIIDETELAHSFKGYVEENNVLENQLFLALAYIIESEHELASELLLQYFPQFLQDDFLNGKYLREAVILYTSLAKHDPKNATMLSHKINLAMKMMMQREPALTVFGIGIAEVYGCLGDKDKALTLLSNLYEKHNYYDEVFILEQSYCFKFLQGDDEFNRILNIAKHKLASKQSDFLKQIKVSPGITTL